VTAVLTPPVAVRTLPRRTVTMPAPRVYLPTIPTAVRSAAGRLVAMLGLTAAVIAAMGLLTGHDPLLTFGFKTPQFVAYQGASAENVRFTMDDGWSQMAAVPGGLIMDWQAGEAQPAVLLTMGNPAAEPEIDALGADGRRIEAIRYRGAWPGVDVVIKSMPGGWSSNMIVEPGVDPSTIALEYVGATALSIDPAGRLHIQSSAGEWIDGTPESWQDGPSGREPVESHYELLGGNRFNFGVGAFDPSRPLVVDPPSERVN